MIPLSSFFARFELNQGGATYRQMTKRFMCYLSLNGHRKSGLFSDCNCQKKSTDILAAHPFWETGHFEVTKQQGVWQLICNKPCSLREK